MREFKVTQKPSSKAVKQSFLAIQIKAVYSKQHALLHAKTLLRQLMYDILCIILKLSQYFIMSIV